DSPPFQGGVAAPQENGPVPLGADGVVESRACSRRRSNHPRSPCYTSPHPRTRRLILKHRIAMPAIMVLALSTIAVWAHHAPSAIFDMGKRISVTGTLTKIDWINPHIVIAMEAKGDGGKT